MNNFSTFTYDGLSKNVGIAETVAGSLTSSSQFIWSALSRMEERNSLGGVTKKFFGRGQTVGASNYFYAKDHLSSVREMTDNAGVVKSDYSFDPYGRTERFTDSVTPDFTYAGYYLHQRSRLNVALLRAYKADAGIWLSREPRGNDQNRYKFCENNPITNVDYLGDSSLRGVDYPPGSEIQTTAPSDVVAVGGHGDEKGAFSFTGDPLSMGPLVSAKELCKILRVKGLIIPGKPCTIQICACHTGEGGSNSFAAQVAKECNCWVIGCRGLKDKTDAHNHRDPIGGPSTTDNLFGPGGFRTDVELPTPETDAEWNRVRNRTK